MRVDTESPSTTVAANIANLQDLESSGRPAFGMSVMAFPEQARCSGTAALTLGGTRPSAGILAYIDKVNQAACSLPPAAPPFALRRQSMWCDSRL